MSRTQIIVAKTAGFCFGVGRAVELVYRLVEEGRRVCTLGPIIHNAQLVADLAEKGVRVVSSPDEVQEGELLVVRTHGVGREIIEALRARGIPFEDATCPYVAHIHKIVADASAKGQFVLIAGDAAHPEVQGIASRCSGGCAVFSGPEELDALLSRRPELKETPLIAVAQTTYNLAQWRICQKTLKRVCTNAVVFDTICKATALRQEEAERLSRQCDVMVVVGGRHSSNTAKLRDVCAQNCPRTVLVETAAELPADVLKHAHRAGVTAGASTPSAIIKEVLNTMSEIQNPIEGNEAVAETVETATTENAENAAAVQEAAQEAASIPAEVPEKAEEPEKVTKSFDEMTFEEALEASLSNLNTDQKVRGVVLSVGPTEIQVDIGRKHAGYIPASEFSADPNVVLTDAVKVGDVLDLIVMRTNDQEGTVMLSKRRYDAIEGWENVVKAKDTEEILDGTVIDVIKGGVLAMTQGVRVFIPASQATLSRSDSLEELKGKNVRFRIIEIGRGRRAVGSIRSVLREERKEQENKFWEQVEVGQHYTGTVKTLTSYGAFVDLGGVDGMVHISELSWARIKHPSEVVNVGDTVDVYVKDIDPEKRKISLGYKKAEDNPWEILRRDYAVGSVVKVQIVSMTPYGAFARVIPGIDGLIHISQIADHRIEKPQDVLEIGQEVDVKITDIEFDKKRVSLSIRALLEPAADNQGDITYAE